MLQLLSNGQPRPTHGGPADPAVVSDLRRCHGWLGVDLLPAGLLDQVTNLEGLRWVLAGFGAFFGLLAGFFFQLLRRRLMRQVRAMPTDLLVSGQSD